MSQDTATQPTQKPSQSSNVLLFVVRLAIVILIGSGLGIGIYLGGSYLANRYFQSVQVNSDRIQSLEDNQTLTEEQVKSRIDSLTERLQTLEKSNDAQKVSDADITSRLAVIETAQSQQTSSLETISKDLDQISTLQAKITSLQSTQQAMSSDLDTVAQENVDQEQMIKTLSADWEEAATAIAVSSQEMQTLKAMELLTRARYNLSQSNLGLARQDIEAARSIIKTNEAQDTAEQPVLNPIILTHLDAALEMLPEYPVSASDEVEGAWNLLVTQAGGFTANPYLVEATPTPELTPTPDLTSTPTSTPAQNP